MRRTGRFNAACNATGAIPGCAPRACWDQFLSLAFAQLTYRESLRDI